MTDVRLALVVVVAVVLAFATSTAGGLAGVASHRTSTAGVVDDPNGYVGLVPSDDGCLLTFEVTNYLDTTLTDVTATVAGAPVVSVTPPGALAPGESGDLAIELDATGETTLSVVITASNGDDVTIHLYRSATVDCAAGVGTRTIGYWKTHDEWPVEELTVGGQSYTRSEAQALLATPDGGDRSLALAKQLVATRLNLAAGTDDACIAGVVADADAWLTAHPVGSGVTGGSAAWTTVADGGEGGEDLKDALDDYNNGRSCVPHAD